VKIHAINFAARFSLFSLRAFSVVLVVVLFVVVSVFLCSFSLFLFRRI